MQGVEFVAVNTDAQDLKMSKADAKIQIGMNLTKGLGAGAKHDIGQAAADESLNEITSYLQGSNMIFITSGMGGGTGTGASHVIARAAKELNILTVGVTTLPFSYEGPKRMRRAIAGLEELKKHLDTVIVVPNQNLFKIASETTTFEESFSLSNDVLKHIKKLDELCFNDFGVRIHFIVPADKLSIKMDGLIYSLSSFPPGEIYSPLISYKFQRLLQELKILKRPVIIDSNKYLKSFSKFINKHPRLIPCVLTGWDNTARYKNKGVVKSFVFLLAAFS